MKRRQAKAIIGAACLSGIYLHSKLTGRVKNIRRLDQNGALYYAEYEGNYDQKLYTIPNILLRQIGCSSFICRNEKNEIITGRNYDLPHKDPKGDPTGLNVIVRCKPKGKYASLNICDLAWFQLIHLPYRAGALDNDTTTKLPLAFLPYFTMDGINEKGLVICILALDKKEGEKACHQSERGKKKITITELVRYSLDSCSSVKEVIELAKSYNMCSIVGFDMHLFISDEKGNSAVLEWRYNTLSVQYIDACTNFYVSFDDACDCIKNGRCKEKYIQPVSLYKKYHYGYGHGYDRFKKIVEVLDKHRNSDVKAILRESECKDLLSAVSQEFDGTDLTSFTQVSTLYNNSTRSLTCWLMRDYKTEYVFKV